MLNNKEDEIIKQYVKKENQDLVNTSISYNADLRVIDDSGTNLGVMKRDAAIEIAKSKDLDLVVISPDASPMVAKILDYPKFKFDREKKAREIKKNQSIIEIKEIRLSPVIDVGDFETRLKQALKFLEKGDKVKISIQVRGRWNARLDMISSKINEFIEKIGKCTVEAAPKLDGKYFTATIAPIKNK